MCLGDFGSKGDVLYTVIYLYTDVCVCDVHLYIERERCVCVIIMCIYIYIATDNYLARIFPCFLLRT